jgi:hypothetical protein
MPRGRPPKPTRLHLIAGTFRRDRHGRRPDAPRAPAEGELTPGQAELLAAMPKELPAAERAVYLDQVRAAWWLRPIDHTLLIACACACVRHTVAGRELNRLMQHPNFVNPASAEAKAGMAYLKIADHAANAVFEVADRLGFSPASRYRLGIDADARPRQPAKDDPWAPLRLREVPKAPDPPDSAPA